MSIIIRNGSAVRRLRLKGLVFDLDDTLVSSPIPWQNVMARYFVASIRGSRLGQVEDRKTRALVWQLEGEIREQAGVSLTAYMTQLADYVATAAICAPRSVDEYRDGFDRLWRQATKGRYGPSTITGGACTLISLLEERGIPIFVVSGGDVTHKREIISDVGLDGMIPPDHVFGDRDPRLASSFSKRDALAHILTMVGRDSQSNPVLAFIGDGVRDMEEAKACTGVIGVGFNQPHLADIVIKGAELPAIALSQVLLATARRAVRSLE